MQRFIKLNNPTPEQFTAVVTTLADLGVNYQVVAFLQTEQPKGLAERSQKVLTCNRCGTENLGWAESRKSVYVEGDKIPKHRKVGEPKIYLASRGEDGTVQPWMPHRCEALNQAVQTEEQADIQAEILNDQAELPDGAVALIQVKQPAPRKRTTRSKKA